MNIPRWNNNPQGQFYVNIYRHETMLDQYDKPHYEFGPPLPISRGKYTQDDLVRMGLVGLYIKPQKKTRSPKADDE